MSLSFREIMWIGLRKEGLWVVSAGGWEVAEG